MVRCAVVWLVAIVATLFATPAAEATVAAPTQLPVTYADDSPSASATHAYTRFGRGPPLAGVLDSEHQTDDLGSIGTSTSANGVRSATVYNYDSGALLASVAHAVALEALKSATATDGGGRLLEGTVSSFRATGVATKTAAVGDDLLKPGPWAQGSVPSSVRDRITTGERKLLNPIGDASGCHSCGASSAGTKSGNWIGDHQPVSRTVPDGTPQVLFPQCQSCSNQQGLWIINLLRQGKL